MRILFSAAGLEGEHTALSLEARAVLYSRLAVVSQATRAPFTAPGEPRTAKWASRAKLELVGGALSLSPHPQQSDYYSARRAVMEKDNPLPPPFLPVAAPCCQCSRPPNTLGTGSHSPWPPTHPTRLHLSFPKTSPVAPPLLLLREASAPSRGLQSGIKSPVNPC